MSDVGAWLGSGLALTLAGSMAMAQDAEPDFEAQVQLFESALSQLGQWDPLHPRVLETRLEYAGYLAQSAADADCASRLQRAQSELDKARATPITELLLPDGRAHELAVDYRIHVTRAGCTQDEAERSRELQAALESAQQSADAYGQAFDYTTMAVMQFNVAHARLLLGNDAVAILGLEALIESGKAYGLRDDAAENYGYLLKWRDGSSDPEKVKAFAASLPVRNAEFKFNWAPFAATGTYEQQGAELVAGSVQRRQAKVSARWEVKRDKGDLLISTQAFAVEASSDAVDDEVMQKLSKFLNRAFASVPDMVVTPKGEFKEVRDVKDFSKRLRKEVDAFVDDLLPKGDARLPEIKRAVDQQMDAVLAPEVIEGKSREGFALDSGMWIDASIEHGSWYEMPMVLSMPGTHEAFIEHDLRFAVARWLPCDARSAEPRCVEIVLFATPDSEQLAAAMKKAAASQGGGPVPWEYWSETRFRVITDPATLKTYSRETRQYSYLGASVKGQRSLDIKSMRTLNTNSY